MIVHSTCAVFIITASASHGFEYKQDAALMLEHSTNRHTEQLREIFSQAGKMYGSEMDRSENRLFTSI